MADNIVSEFRANRRAKAVLNRLLATKQVSSSGLKWLEVACDPFHDTEITPDGFPDLVTTRSIVQCVTKTFSVSKPAGAATWDMHVFFNPCSPSFRQGAAIGPEPEAERNVRTVAPNNRKLDQNGKGTNCATQQPRPASRRRLDDVVARTTDICDTDGSLEDGDDTGGAKMETRTRSGVGAVVHPGYYRTTVNFSGRMIQDGTGNALISGWNVLTISTGQNWATQAATTYTEPGYPRNYAAGSYRLIATGLEVVNTTASLYKGGAVTVYRSPCPETHFSGFTMDVTHDDPMKYLGTAKVGTLPPTIAADAALFPNSKTWGADEGCYLTGCMNSIENPYFTPTPGISGLMTPTSYSDMENGTGWVGYFPKLFSGTENGYTDLSACTTLWPWDITGGIFQGLNENSTMQVTVKYYIERHPSIAEPDLLVLSRNPCPYDPLVLELYARSMHELPVGVPVGMNPLGEWFNEVLDAVSTWAPEIGKAVGNIIPGATLVGNAVGKGAGLWLAQNRKNGSGGGKPASITKTVTEKKPNGNVKQTKIVTKPGTKKYTKAEKRAFQKQMGLKPKAPKAPGTSRRARNRRAKKLGAAGARFKMLGPVD